MIYDTSLGRMIWSCLVLDGNKFKMENKKYHTVGTVPKSNRKIVERGKIDTPKGPVTW